MMMGRGNKGIFVFRLNLYGVASAENAHLLHTSDIYAIQALRCEQYGLGLRPGFVWV